MFCRGQAPEGTGVCWWFASIDVPELGGRWGLLGGLLGRERAAKPTVRRELWPAGPANWVSVAALRGVIFLAFSWR